MKEVKSGGHRWLLIVLLSLAACAQNNQESVDHQAEAYIENLPAMLDSIWRLEQRPVTMRDSLMEIYGVDSEEADVYQKLYRKNHAINMEKIRHLLDTYGWPDRDLIKDQGNLTICNVLQHDNEETRAFYVPMMRQAVLDGQLDASLLVRTEDRLATDRGELQIYGGQMKYYPETQSFNVWPVYDPANIDQRRAEIGLGPIAEYLQERFNFEWNLEEQLERTRKFEEGRR